MPENARETNEERMREFVRAREDESTWCVYVVCVCVVRVVCACGVCVWIMCVVFVVACEDESTLCV